MCALEAISIASVEPGQEALAAELVTKVFNQFVAPLFPPEGVSEFLSYATPQALVQRLSEGNLMLAVWAGERVLGFIELRKPAHIAMFFIAEDQQRHGMGRSLIRQALALWRERGAGFAEVTVNASPNAVEAYHCLGFEPTGELQTHNGISFVPMALAIKPESGHT